MTERDYNENYRALFEDAAGSYFGHERVLAAVTPEVAPLVIEGIRETGG